MALASMEEKERHTPVRFIDLIHRQEPEGVCSVFASQRFPIDELSCCDTGRILGRHPPELGRSQ